MKTSVRPFGLLATAALLALSAPAQAQTTQLTPPAARISAPPSRPTTASMKRCRAASRP